MINAQKVSKSFEKIKAVDNVTAQIRDGNVFGLIGTNGAGKSTFLRMLCGILKPDSGMITLDEEPVYENVLSKKRIFYISDDQFFFQNSTAEEMEQFYKNQYENFDAFRFFRLLDSFSLDKRRKINTFSKGMKKQLSIICAISAMTDYIFCDETFDGLDPVMRQSVKSLFASDIADRNMTPVIASHNLRELEDICDYVGLLHRGGILLQRDIDDMKLNIHKLQCVFSKEMKREDFSELQVLSYDTRGSMVTLVARGQKEEIVSKIHNKLPMFAELLPLSLEEIFICETEVAGYDIKKLLF